MVSASARPGLEPRPRGGAVRAGGRRGPERRSRGIAGSVVHAAAEIVLPGGTTTFGTYELVPLLTDDTPYAGPATPTTLTGVAVGPDVRELLKDASVSGRCCATGS